MVTGIGEFVGSDGFGERDDEAKEVFRGVGVAESDDVVLGVDDFGWGLELVRWGDGGDFLGLRDWG